MVEVVREVMSIDAVTKAAFIAALAGQEYDHLQGARGAYMQVSHDHKIAAIFHEDGTSALLRGHFIISTAHDGDRDQPTAIILMRADKHVCSSDPSLPCPYWWHGESINLF